LKGIGEFIKCLCIDQFNEFHASLLYLNAQNGSKRVLQVGFLIGVNSYTELVQLPDVYEVVQIKPLL